MNITALISALALTALSASLTAFGAPAPWIGTLGSSEFCIQCPPTSLLIPAGKILIIEALSSSSAADVQLRITGSDIGGILTNSFTADFTHSVPGADRVLVLPSPIRLGPGMRLSRETSDTKVTLYGIVMDSQDFFASVSPSIRGVTSDGSQLTAVVDTRTTMPTRVSGESSTNLTEWTEAGITVATSASNPRISRITTPQDAPQKFIRARAMRRSVVGSED